MLEHIAGDNEVVECVVLRRHIGDVEHGLGIKMGVGIRELSRQRLGIRCGIGEADSAKIERTWHIRQYDAAAQQFAGQQVHHRAVAHRRAALRARRLLALQRREGNAIG